MRISGNLPEAQGPSTALAALRFAPVGMTGLVINGLLL